MIIQNPKLIFRNFQGKADTYNPAGCRNFCVVLDEENEAKAIALGYNVRVVPVPDGEKYLKVYLPSSHGFEGINTAKVLDKGSLSVSKIALAGMEWELHGMRGVKLFLVEMEF